MAQMTHAARAFVDTARAADAAKEAAAAAAIALVEDGMKLGLGTGSTATHFVRLLGERVTQGLSIVGVPTSEKTAQLARKHGVGLTTLDETPRLDLAIDGADEIDPDLRLIKGGGGALLQEKIVAAASDRVIVIADASKCVERLGAHALPIEIIPFGATATINGIRSIADDLGLTGSITIRERADGVPFVTDCRHFIVDAAFGSIADAEALAHKLNLLPGVVENGLFLGIADGALVADANGVRSLGTSA